MPRPTKIPVVYAFDTLNANRRGYDRIYPVNIQEIESVSMNNGALVQVHRLRNLFANTGAFQEYKNGISVPDNYWQRAIATDPTITPYARRFMSSSRSRSPSPAPPAKRGRPRSRRPSLKMLSKLGTLTDQEIAGAEEDQSVMSILPSNDECDDQDVNLPLPTCQAIRRVCRYYNPMRQYIPYKPDHTENKRYKFQVSYPQTG